MKEMIEKILEENDCRTTPIKFIAEQILQTPLVECSECKGQLMRVVKDTVATCSCTNGLISIEQVMEQNKRMKEVVDKIVSVLGHLSSPHKTEITIIQDSTLHNQLKDALKVGK